MSRLLFALMWIVLAVVFCGIVEHLTPLRDYSDYVCGIVVGWYIYGKRDV